MPEVLKAHGKAFVGQWVSASVTPLSQVTGAEKPGGKVPGRCTCRWILDGAALEWRGKAGDVQFHALVFWDPGAKHLKALGIDSRGFLQESLVIPEGRDWLFKGTLTAPNGRKYALEGRSRFEGKDRHTNLSSDGKEEGTWVTD